VAHLINNIRLQNFLSFGPNGKTIRMENLNVLIGPNGSGKSNFIEALEVLHATAGGLSELIRQGGAPADWIWRGRNPGRHTSLAEAQIEVMLRENQPTPEMLYRLAFTESGSATRESAHARNDVSTGVYRKWRAARNHR
jgi:predicted ATPase